MKKSALLSLIMILLLGVFSGCSESIPQKSKEALKAEIKAEMEAEKQAAEKSFEDILSADGLKEALDFYEQQVDTFGQDLKKEWLIKIVSELGRRSVAYTEALDKIERDDPSMPPLLEYEDILYKSVYDAKSNTLFLSSLNDDNRNAVKKVLSDDVFILSKLYFIDYNYVEFSGFVAVIPYALSVKLREWAAGLDEKIEFYQYEFTRYPNACIKASDTEFKPSGDTYDMVSIESKENMNLLLPGSKTEAYLKVNTDESEKPSVEIASLVNDISQGYTYRLENDVLKLKYTNTGDEIDLVKPRPAQNDDPTTFISHIQNIQRSHDGTRLFFEVPAFAVTDAIHVVDLLTLEEKFFTDGNLIQNVGEEPYLDAVIVLKQPMTDSGRGVAYCVMDGQGNEICDLGPKLDGENLIEQITKAGDKRAQ